MPFADAWDTSKRCRVRRERTELGMALILFRVLAGMSPEAVLEPTRGHLAWIRRPTLVALLG
jgi:hypothetical protein